MQTPSHPAAAPRHSLSRNCTHVAKKYESILLLLSAPGRARSRALTAQMVPWEVTATWISWDGYEWHTCKNFQYVTKEHELDGMSDDDDLFDEEAEFAAYQEAEKKREEEEREAAERGRAADAAKAKRDEAETEGKDGKKKGFFGGGTKKK